jgi:hypothetical protein
MPNARWTTIGDLWSGFSPSVSVPDHKTRDVSSQLVAARPYRHICATWATEAVWINQGGQESLALVEISTV